MLKLQTSYSKIQKLPREFYNRETTLVAKELLGCYLVHHIDGVQKIGKIVEVEAYLGQHDLACHSSKGMTKRTATLFGPPGYAYVYMIYGMYYCFNVVTELSGIGSAVLIRALEPVAAINERTHGPGLLCQAMCLDKRYNAHDLLSDTLFITNPPIKESFHIVESPRIGVHYAKEWATKLLRFYIQDSNFISSIYKKRS